MPQTTLSVIIPSGDASRDGNLSLLLEDVRCQSVPPDQVEVVRGVAPNGRARNAGVERVTGDILVFLDDDVRLGSPELFKSFVEHLQSEPRLGLVGTAQQLPPDSTRFQVRSAAQIPRSVSSIVDTLTESDMVTTQCCAIRRAVLAEVGGFHDRILRGVDPELRHRLRKAGYRIAVVPHAWHYHPMPESVPALLRMAWRNGAASAYAQKHFPETVLFNPEGHVAEFKARRSLPERALRHAGRLARDLVTGRFYGLLYGAAYTGGRLLWRG